MILGLIPECDLEKVSSAGNAAGTGARITLLEQGGSHAGRRAGSQGRENRDRRRAEIPGTLRVIHVDSERWRGRSSKNAWASRPPWWISIAMQKTPSNNERMVLADTVREAYMEIFPTDSIEDKLDVLEPGSYVAVTCSPSKGIAATLDMSERLASRGFKVVPHIAAKMVKDKQHLGEIIARLNDMPIISLFIPGGDAEKPAGDYTRAFEVLRDVADFEHRFTEIGIAGHPEGHPAVSDDVLLEDYCRSKSMPTTS